MKDSARFSKKTIDFLTAAGSSKDSTWLDRHKKEHEDYLVRPFSELANYLFDNLGRTKEARGYRFPLRGFGRLRRPKHKVGRGEPAYRNWVHLRASRPSKSIFDENPGLYFNLASDEIMAGGGLYEASSRQVKELRAWLAEDPKDLQKLFKSKAFKDVFPKGFETEKILKTFPRNYPQDHKRIEWLRLQAFYVIQNFTKKELFSKDFKDIVLENWTQTLRLNELLYANFTVNAWRSSKQAEDLPESMDEETTERGPDLWDERF